MYEQASRPTPPPPPPASSLSAPFAPGYPGFGPQYPYRSPYGGPARRLRRSRTNRRIAGVAGGLGDYFGIDATVLRLGFVLVSFLFLAVIGGPVIYFLACLAMPQEEIGATPGQPFAAAAPMAPGQGAFGGRPWHDWDRTARSWVVVLGALVLASAWAFGVGPGIHWGALPLWIILAALIVWAVGRSRSASRWANSSASGPASQQAPPAGDAAGTGPGPGVTVPGGTAPGGTAPGTDPGSTGPGSTGFGGTGPEGAVAAATGGVMSAAVVPDPTLPVNPAGAPAPADRASQEETDWAQAQTAAAQWAKEQLDVVGIRPDPSAAPTPPALPAVASLPAAAPRRRRSGPVRRTITLLLALGVGLLLLAVVGAGGIAIGSGSSLRGGVGKTSYSPPALSSVASRYRLGVGHLDVDLSAVRFPARGRTVDVTLGVGQLTIEVPSDASVTVDAGAGLGQLTIFGEKQSGAHVQVIQVFSPNVVSGPLSKPPHLTVDAHVGLGQVIVTSGQVPSPPAPPGP